MTPAGNWKRVICWWFGHDWYLGEEMVEVREGGVLMRCVPCLRCKLTVYGEPSGDD